MRAPPGVRWIHETVPERIETARIVACLFPMYASPSTTVTTSDAISALQAPCACPTVVVGLRVAVCAPPQPASSATSAMRRAARRIALGQRLRPRIGCVLADGELGGAGQPERLAV